MGQPDEHYSQCNSTVHGMGGSADASYPFSLEARSAVVIEVEAEFPAVLAVVGSDGGEVACAQGVL